jgi:hypothetical protein
MKKFFKAILITLFLAGTVLQFKAAKADAIGDEASAFRERLESRNREYEDEIRRAHEDTEREYRESRERREQQARDNVEWQQKDALEQIQLELQDR